ncbi:TonB-dependent receptor plug domain-containing protein [Aquimarina pacifica]|uniref:TonB-dependent receptor plug domain-containing protein n=1 Tax=Aquimarina pacifica TaxID=1296415 RepID=UPI0004707795|nr:TonB-dependent receptor plug domain-containing protein [Aquimarina pacifica]
MTRFLGVYLFLWSILASSQEEAQSIILKNEQLRSAITHIETLYDVKFSYIDEIIDNKKVSLTIPPQGLIENILIELQNQTRLKFTITGDDYITISPFKKKDVTTACGYIFDEKKIPLSNIQIFFKTNRTSIKTDETGYFETDLAPYNSVVLISAPGFRQKVLKSRDFQTKKCTEIYLTNTQEEILDEVIIQEYLIKGITQNKKIIHIDLKDIEILPGQTEPDILQSVQLTPGVNNPFETASGLYVRGSSPNQNLILWNGIKTYKQGHFFGMLSAFNPYVVKEVEFSKSGVSAKYGDRIGGVVSIQSENEVPNKFTGGAGFNMINADIVTSIPIIQDKVSFQVSARRSFADLLNTFTYDQLSERVFQNTKITDSAVFPNNTNTFYYADYNANLLIKPSSSNTIEINTIYGKNDLDFRRSDTVDSFNDELVTENEGYNINWKHSYNQNVSQNVSGYYTRYLLDYNFVTIKSEDIIEVESKQNRIKDFGGNYNIDYQLSEYQNISGGYQFSNNTIKYNFSSITPDYELILDQDNRSLNTHAGYVEYKFDKPTSFNTAVGVRINHYTEINKTSIEPRLFIQKNLSKSWKINASGEFRSQAVSQIQESVVSDLSLENKVWTLANTDKFPLTTSYQFTFGNSIKKNNWYIDIDSYYKKIDNITTLTAGFINPIDNTYHNGESTVFGADVFIKKRIKNYKTWVSYSYIDTRNIFEGINDNQSFPGNWNIEHTVKWSHFYKINTFQFSLGWIWHTGKSFTNISGVDDSGEIIVLEFDKINSNNLPVYHRLDFSAIYDFRFKLNSKIKYRLGFSLINIYNRKNILNKEFRTTNTLSNRLINNDIQSLGINPNLSFRVFW